MAKRRSNKAAARQEKLNLQPEGGRHILYVYGSLRTGVSKQVYNIPGAIWDCGAYPGARLFHPSVQEYITCEKIIVDDERLYELDQYEGFKPHDPENSLFIRKPVWDGQLYVYNGEVTFLERIPSGDWLDWCNNRKKTTRLSPQHLQGSTVIGPDADFGKPVLALPAPADDKVTEVEIVILPDDNPLAVLDDYKSGAK